MPVCQCVVSIVAVLYGLGAKEYRQAGQLQQQEPAKCQAKVDCLIFNRL